MPRPYVKTRAARGKRRARKARPLVSHRPPLFCQGRRDTLVGYARQLNTPAAAAQTGGWVSSTTRAGRGRHAQGPRLPYRGPGESGLRDSGGTHVEPWSRRERHPAALCRRGQSKPPRRAESLGGGDGGAEGSPLIRRGIRRDTFPPGGGRLFGGCGIRRAPLSRGERLWAVVCRAAAPYTQYRYVSSSVRPTRKSMVTP